MPVMLSFTSAASRALILILIVDAKPGGGGSVMPDGGGGVKSDGGGGVVMVKVVGGWCSGTWMHGSDQFRNSHFISSRAKARCCKSLCSCTDRVSTLHIQYTMYIWSTLSKVTCICCYLLL